MFSSSTRMFVIWVQFAGIFASFSLELFAVETRSHPYNSRSCNWKKIQTIVNTLQGTNISHLRKRKIIFKYTLGGDMLVPRRVIINQNNHQPKTHPYFRKVSNFSFPPHRPFFSKLNIIFRSQNPTIGGQGGRHNGQQKKHITCGVGKAKSQRTVEVKCFKTY